MKKLIWFASLVILSALPLAAQADFSGTAEIGLDGNISNNNFSSILNPGNVLELKDFAATTDLTAKLDAGDDKTTFSAWFALKSYPIGQVLLYSGVPASTVSEISSELGDSIISFNIMRFNVNVNLGDYVSLEVGRQSMLTGYGYGWNPIDFANPLKNPADPDAALRGVDALSVSANIGSVTTLKLYGIIPDNILSSGVDYNEIKGGGELTLSLTGLEMKFDGFYDYDATAGSDAYTPSLGTGFMADLAGIGFYGEAAVRKGSRNYFWDGTTAVNYRKDSWLFSGLVGLEYTFPSELYAIVEFFYNGEGYDKAERTEFKDSVIAIGTPTSDLLSSYRPGYYARHYVMINLTQPLYSIETNLNFSAIFSPDSGALTVLPSISYNFSGNFTGRIDYIGMFDLYKGDFS